MTNSMEYHVVQGNWEPASGEELLGMFQSEVASMVAEQWVPLGGVAVTQGVRGNGTSYYTLFQALTREAQPDPNAPIFT